MARVPGSDIYEVRVQGAGPVAAHFGRAARQLQDAIIAELRDLQNELDVLFDSYAPEDTGQTRDAMRPVLNFIAAQPRLSIRVGPIVGHGGDPRDYFDVPRFGHREQVIYPTQRRALKVHLMGHRNPHLVEFRAWVTGVGHPHPDQLRVAARNRLDMRAFRRAFAPTDWVAEAGRAAEAHVNQMEARLGRRIDARIML